MATSVVPALLDALVTTLTAALPTVTVLDGEGITGDPGDWLMVGVDDPDKETAPNAATTTEEQGAFGSTRPRMENGSIFLTAFSWNGDSNQKAARDAVYATAAAVANAIRTDTLGVSGLLSIGYGEATTYRQGQADPGAGAELLFSVKFMASI